MAPGAISPRFREAFLSLSSDFCGVPVEVCALFVRNRHTTGGPGFVESSFTRASTHDSNREDPANLPATTSWHAIEAADITRGKDLT
jgi:hypothetical protein